MRFQNSNDIVWDSIRLDGGDILHTLLTEPERNKKIEISLCETRWFMYNPLSLLPCYGFWGDGWAAGSGRLELCYSDVFVDFQLYRGLPDHQHSVYNRKER